ncbi:Hypothetical predicted protein [Octopus vulgaris]|uniref:Uncharacterized protein n=1 Tax=Octopus vulgaris TaxID=6645 RepID=A0AA36AQD9_OCTVU|nr:Hypothetical predicted protein [Octopus vulgaris]
MERDARKVVGEKKSLRDVAVKQRIVDEINERKSKPKRATGTERATKGKGKSTKTVTLTLQHKLLSRIFSRGR